MEIGQLHFGLALVSMVTGTAVVLRPKGTAIHRVFGFLYASSMLGLNATALTIFNLTGTFGPFHVLALISLVTVAIGVGYPLLRRPARLWVGRHAYWMAWSYVGLMAAAASEAFTRLPNAPFWWAVIAASGIVLATGAWLINTRIPRILTSQFGNLD